MGLDLILLSTFNKSIERQSYCLSFLIWVFSTLNCFFVVQESCELTVHYGWDTVQNILPTSRKNRINYDKWMHLKARSWRECPGLFSLTLWHGQDDKTQHQVYAHVFAFLLVNITLSFLWLNKIENCFVHTTLLEFWSLESPSLSPFRSLKYILLSFRLSPAGNGTGQQAKSNSICDHLPSEALMPHGTS